MKTMWDISYNNEEKEGRITGIDIEPVSVIRQGIKPGCTAESITVLDNNGRKFDSTASCFYDSEKDAKAAAIRILKDSIESSTKQIMEELKDIESTTNVLNNLLSSFENEV